MPSLGRLHLYSCLATALFPFLTMSAQFGELFILMFPVNHSAKLYFFTSLLARVKVNVTKENFRETFQQQITVNGTVMASMVLDKVSYGGLATNETLGTYVFRGNGPFAITALLLSDSGVGESFQAVPVSAFHKTYVVPPLRGKVFIICVTIKNSTLITVSYNNALPPGFSLNNNLAVGGPSMEYTVEREAQSFTIDSINVTDRFTGCILSSNQPIGLIVGSYMTHYCSDSNIAKNTSMTEMLLPVDYFGKTYIIFKTRAVLADERLTFTAISSNTTVEITRHGAQKKEWYIFSNIGTSEKVDVEHSLVAVSDNPIGCFLVICIRCDVTTSDVQSVSLLQLIPVEMFYNFYSWSKFDDWNNAVELFLLFVIQKPEIQLLNIKSEASVSVQWETEVEYQGWIVGRMAMSDGVSHVWMKNFNFFGCYVVGLTFGWTLAHPLGFQKSCISGAHQDCDGYSEKAFQSLVVDTGNKVSGSCPEKTFGERCEQQCDHCIPDCDRVSGICSECSPGFTNILNACREECPVMTFGKDCAGDCFVLCGYDCLDRVQGLCKAKSNFAKVRQASDSQPNIWGLGWFFLPATIVCFIILVVTLFENIRASRQD